MMTHAELTEEAPELSRPPPPKRSTPPKCTTPPECSTPSKRSTSPKRSSSPRARKIVPLSAAIRRGDALVVARLLREGADPNRVETRADGTSQSPLVCAITAGHPNVVRLLLDAGADPNEELASSSKDKPQNLLLLANQLQRTVELRMLSDAVSRSRTSPGRTNSLYFSVGTYVL